MVGASLYYIIVDHVSGGVIFIELKFKILWMFLCLITFAVKNYQRTQHSNASQCCLTLTTPTRNEAGESKIVSVLIVRVVSFEILHPINEIETNYLYSLLPCHKPLAFNSSRKVHSYTTSIKSIRSGPKSTQRLVIFCWHPGKAQYYVSKNINNSKRTLFGTPKKYGGEWSPRKREPVYMCKYIL